MRNIYFIRYSLLMLLWKNSEYQYIFEQLFILVFCPDPAGVRLIQKHCTAKPGNFLQLQAGK